LISFLQQCEALLKPASVLSSVVPDKRYCFDYFSSGSSTGNVFDAYAGQRVTPSHGHIFDHFDTQPSEMATLRGHLMGWQGRTHLCINV